MQEEILKCVVMRGRDEKPIAIVTEGEDKGVICLFDRGLKKLPEIGKTIYTFNYEVRTKAHEGGEKKYGIIYSWHYAPEDAEKERIDFITKQRKERLEREMQNAITLTESLKEVSQEDKEKIKNLILRGEIPEKLDSVDLLFFRKEEDKVEICICAKGFTYKYPDNAWFREEMLVKSGGHVVRVDPAFDSVISRLELRAREYDVDGVRYLIFKSPEEYRKTKTLLKIYEKLYELHLPYDLEETVIEKIIEKLWKRREVGGDELEGKLTTRRKVTV